MISRIDIEDMTDAQDEAPWVDVWLRFAENGNIRKWDREPFLEGDQYVHGSLFRSALSERDEARAEVDRLTAARPSQAGDERVAKAAKVLLDSPEALRTLVNFQLRHSASASNKARSMRHLQMKTGLRALAAMDTPKGGGDE